MPTTMASAMHTAIARRTGLTARVWIEGSVLRETKIAPPLLRDTTGEQCPTDRTGGMSEMSRGAIFAASDSGFGTPRDGGKASGNVTRYLQSMAR
jgi:hypothetical protein